MSDIDKIYNLLEKVYVELQDTRKEVKSNTQRLDNLEVGQKKLDNRMSKMETFLEHDIKEKLQVLHERAGANTDKLEEHTRSLEAINSKLDFLNVAVSSQDKRLEIVESSKRKKAK